LPIAIGSPKPPHGYRFRSELTTPSASGIEAALAALRSAHDRRLRAPPWQELPMSSARPNEAAIRAWCTNYLAQTLELPAEEIGAETRFVRLGLDSASAVHFIVELEEWLGIELEPELAFDHPTIADLARHLAECGGEGDRAR
jgi:acyl carrier protein